MLVANESQSAAYWLADTLVEINQLTNHATWGFTDVETNDFFPGFYSQGIFHTFGGTRLSFPIFGTMDVLYYNVDWLAEMGFTNPPDSPEVFEEAACTAIRQPFSGSTENRMKGLSLNASPSSFADWTFAFGGRIYDQGLKQYKHNSSAAAEAMSFLQGLINRGCATNIPSPDGDQAEFGRGILLFTIGSIDEIPDFRANVQAEANFNWRIAPLPHSTNQPISSVSGINVSIPKTTPEDQLASWLFLRYFSNPEVQTKWVNATNTLPVREDTANYLGEYFASSPAYQMTFELLRNSIKEPAVPGYSLVRDLAQGVFEEILNGTDISTSLDRLTSEANLLLEDLLILVSDVPVPWVDVDPIGQSITFWHQHSGPRQDVFEEIINEFNATNKWGISVVSEGKGGYGDIFLELLPVLGMDDSPNLVMAYPHHAAAYHAAGGLIDLTSLIESTRWGITPREIGDLFTSAFEQDIFKVFDRVRLGYPIQRSTDVLYYNQTWLAELGYENPPETPEDFRRMACAARTPFRGSSVEGSVGYHFYLDANRFTSWVFSFGGNIFNEENVRFTYNSEGVKTATRFLLDLIESECAIPVLDRSDAQIAFAEGSLLFMVDSSFQIPAVTKMVENDQDFEWAVSPIPTNLEEPSQNIFGASISIPASSPETELAAWLFIKYFSTPEVQAKWGRGSGYLPVSRTAGDYLSDYFEINPNYHIAYGLMPYSRTEPSLPGLDFVHQEVELALGAIFEGEDLLETLDALNASTNQMLTVYIER